MLNTKQLPTTWMIATVLVALCLTSSIVEASNQAHDQNDQAGQPSRDHTTYTLLPTHRIINGIVESVAGDQAKVSSGETGEMSPRYLSLKRAKDKGFTIKVGDQVEIVVNEKNHVVDYHLKNSEGMNDQRVIQGMLAQPMNVGQENAVIQMQDGKKESFPVRPLARSEVAAIPLDTEALFLIDESKQIASAALKGDVKSEYDEKEIGWARTPAKNVYRHVDGVIQGKPSEQKLTIRTKHNQTIALPVWDYLEEDMAKLSEGMEVTLLVDHNDKVVNIAFSQKERN